ncbi:MAG: leucine--tRNA ligase [Verrucomicrobia bacterium]|nr:leucine--tRNA ligase [Cytophagales bacterium]
MSEYSFRAIEKKWQQRWEENKVYKTEINKDKPKFYVLDMFPYPSGAGLHVGHPLGYIATDIIARYKRLKGYNVLHPMGFDSFGLPAEQYAIQTGQHPAITTEENINTFKKQLRNIGFSYDWDREIRTSSPDFYKWTQWIFIKLFHSFYNKNTDKAEPIENLIAHFENHGTENLKAHAEENTPQFSVSGWKNFSETEKQKILLNYRLAYLDNMTVNWCPALGTVLANDEVKDGVSERGGYPVIRKDMQQWAMRITAYSERLLQGLETIDWSEAMKDMQRNWIGKSTGALLTFRTPLQPSPVGRESGLIGKEISLPIVTDSMVNYEFGLISEETSSLANPNSLPTGEGWGGVELTVFTTRIDTIFGVSYIVLAPEHELVPSLITEDYRETCEKYVETAKNRSERDRQADVKTVSGAFTGSYAINPFNGEQIPVWVADYVLAGYGTGVVMGVPSSDERDFRFATHFNLPILRVIAGTENLENPTEIKRGKLINSGFLNGLETEEAIQKAVAFAEEKGIGKGKINYRMRDAIFARQRYWGEPIPIYYQDGLPQTLSESELPLILPEIDKYLPTEDGEPPLARAKNWSLNSHSLGKGGDSFPLELNTMPGWAGSSWYWYRYMDTDNEQEFAGKEAINYWQDIDLYLGGAEHATGHLLYSRFWNHFLYDLGLVPKKEFAKKLINQGMISGVSEKIYRLQTKGLSNADESSTKYQGMTAYHFPQGNFISSDRARIIYVSEDIAQDYEKQHYSLTLINIPIEFVESNILNVEKFFASDKENLEACLVCKDGYYTSDEFVSFNESTTSNFKTKPEVEKMSKRWRNVVNPDDIVEKYGADTLRLFEMFLGPLEQSKPWDTRSIDGCYKFLRKLWRLFYDENGKWLIKDETPTPAELKTLHKTIKKVSDDLEKYSFNTVVSTLMICVNELKDLNCSKKAVLQDLLIILSPYAPHIAEELWEQLGNTDSITQTDFPVWNEEFIREDAFEYPISINGKVRAKITFSLDTTKEEIEKSVLASEQVQKWLEGKEPKKVIVVPKKIVNVVV